MAEWLIGFSIRNRGGVMFAALIFILSGLYHCSKMRLDAFPDTTPVMVQVNCTAPSLSPLELESQVTARVEQVLAGVPALREMRSLTKFGFAQLTLFFDDSMDILKARQLVGEKLAEAELPDGVDRPTMGPISTGLGEIFHYIIFSKEKSLMSLTEFQEWEVAPRLRAVPGVAEVSTWGGERRQFQVLLDPSELVRWDIGWEEVVSALKRSNLAVDGGLLSVGGESHMVSGKALARTTEDLGAIFVKSHDQVPVLLQDIATIREAPENRRGAVTAEGLGEVVLGLGFMLYGENSLRVSELLKNKFHEIEKSCPPGITMKLLYCRSDLVNQVLQTVRKNLLEGAILVVVILFLFLGRFRAGFIVALAIPLSMIFAGWGMVKFGIAGSLLSLGALDFGLIVDSTVILVENSQRRLDESNGENWEEIVERACLEVREPTLFGELIIMVVFLPVLTLEGMEGRLFAPLVLTMLFALLGSMIFSMTLMPALCSMFLRPGGDHREGILLTVLQGIYHPLLRLALRWRYMTLFLLFLLIPLSSRMASSIGWEFLPKLSEMSLVVNTIRLASISLEESVRYGAKIEDFLKTNFPDEIQSIWTRTGTAEISTDPMGVELSDIFITLNPREKWKRGKTQDELSSAIERELRRFPGMNFTMSQPIEIRMNELLGGGVKSDFGVKLFGEDIETLKTLANRIGDIMKTVRGASGVAVEQITGAPTLEVKVDPTALGRFGIFAEEVLSYVEGLAGIKVGEVREGNRRFDLVVRLADRFREGVNTLGDIMVRGANGDRIQLSSLATIVHSEGPSTITRELGKRRILISSNIVGRDLRGFVEEIKTKLDRDLKIPEGYFFTFGGDYEHLIRAQRRLLVVVPLSLFLVLILLSFSTGSLRDAILIFSGAPFAFVGGLFALWGRDMPFTISAAVGFIAVSGVATLNGLVMVSAIGGLLKEGKNLAEAIEQAALQRLRPILMTALVAALGFVPMAVNTGVGAEIQAPLASVVIGGIVASTLLTLVFFPAIYLCFSGRGADVKP